jgi:hypothetical protein
MKTSSSFAKTLAIAGFQIVAVPEPSSMALAVMGGFGVLLMKRRFKKN